MDFARIFKGMTNLEDAGTLEFLFFGNSSKIAGYFLIDSVTDFC